MILAIMTTIILIRSNFLNGFSNRQVDCLLSILLNPKLLLLLLNLLHLPLKRIHKSPVLPL